MGSTIPDEKEVVFKKTDHTPIMIPSLFLSFFLTMVQDEDHDTLD